MHRTETEIRIYVEAPRGYEDLPANEKFVTVMTSSSGVVIKELAKSVWKAFQQRLHHSVCVIFLAFTLTL